MLQRPMTLRARDTATSNRRAGRRLRAFQAQQLRRTLAELELPRMLAPDWPSDCRATPRASCG